jgi:hypothetical protein
MPSNEPHTTGSFNNIDHITITFLFAVSMVIVCAREAEKTLIQINIKMSAWGKA